MNPMFEWDETKAKSNLNKHGVSFEEASTVFADPLAVIFDDPDHSEEEVREIILGYSDQNRLLLVCFTERDNNLRIISSRVATAKERKSHEENPMRGQQDE